MSLWRKANDSSQLSLELTGTGVAIVTDAGRYSYVARYRPFHSSTDATYDFLLEYACEEGQFSLQAMDDERQCWLPSRVADFGYGTVIRRALSVDVPAGTRFSLYLSNNRPDGNAVSRFTLRRLLGSVSVDELVPESVPEGAKRSDSWKAGAMLAASLRRLKARASSVVIEQARARYEAPFVENSDRVRELENRVAALRPLQDLAPMEQFLRANRPAALHQNASGDFQLLAREHWFELRGFAEFAMYSMNIDGLFECVAHGAGIQEKVLEMPLCIYHFEHEKWSGWTPEGEALLKQRIAESGITWLDASAVHIWSAYMEWLQRPMIFNGSDWGFGDVVLPETILQPALDNV
jgi:hypothetical protein